MELILGLITGIFGSLTQFSNDKKNKEKENAESS